MIERDWRIGLKVKPKNPNHALAAYCGTVIAIYPSGKDTIVDPNGVLKIRIHKDLTVLVPADDWVTG